MKKFVKINKMPDAKDFFYNDLFKTYELTTYKAYELIKIIKPKENKNSGLVIIKNDIGNFVIIPSEFLLQQKPKQILKEIRKIEI